MTLNVIMYHYVRNNEEKEFDTYCRRINEFEAQIDFFEKLTFLVSNQSKTAKNRKQPKILMKIIYIS